jgi:cellobiose-specific phosphotransferase system component IIC
MLAVTVEATQTMPFMISGYFSTAGQAMGIFLQVFNFILSGLVYYPFFRCHELKLVEKYGTQEEKDIASTSLFLKLFKFLLHVQAKKNI